MSGRKVNLGVVGCGYVARLDYFPFFARPDVRERIRVVAVCDVYEEAAKQAQQMVGADRYYTDYQRIIDDPQIEAVALLTPITLHHPQAVAAIEAGKHVYVQKTMTETVAEATDLIERAEKNKVLLTAAPGMMISPYLQLARQIIRDGLIGKVSYIRARGGHSGYEKNTDPGWRYKQGGGPVMNTGVYALHSVTGIMGAAKRVSAMSGIAVPVRYYQGRPIEVEVDDNTIFNLDFGESCFGQVDSSYQIVKSETPLIEIYGQKGAISAQSFGWTRHPRPIAVWAADPIEGLVKDEKTGWWVPSPDRKLLDPEFKHTTLDVQHFADCLLDGVQPISTAERARHVIEIINKGYESAKSGQTIPLETVPWSVGK